MWLHVLGHIEADQIVLAPEEFGGQGLRQLCLTNTGWSHKEERTDWAFRVLQASARAPDGTSNHSNSFILADNALAQIILQVT